jgi:hypothetical protein
LSSHFKEVGKVSGKSDAEPQIMASSVEVVYEEPLVARVLPNVFETIHMDQLATQYVPVARDQLGVGQIHCQYGIVLLHIRTEQEQRSAIQSQFELRQKTRVVEVDAVRIAFTSDDVASVVEQGECITGFQRARAAFLKRDVRFDVKRRRLIVVGPPRYRRALASIVP